MMQGAHATLTLCLGLPTPPRCPQAASSGYQWLNKDPVAFMAGFLGWFAPSNIAVPAFGNQSLFGAFTKSIGEELAHFPTVSEGGRGIRVASASPAWLAGWPAAQPVSAPGGLSTGCLFSPWNFWSLTCDGPLLRLFAGPRSDRRLLAPDGDLAHGPLCVPLLGPDRRAGAQAGAEQHTRKLATAILSEWRAHIPKASATVWFTEEHLRPAPSPICRATSERRSPHPRGRSRAAAAANFAPMRRASNLEFITITCVCGPLL